MPNCGRFCSLEDFYNITEFYTTDDWNKECFVDAAVATNNSDLWPFNTGNLYI